MQPGRTSSSRMCESCSSPTPAAACKGLGSSGGREEFGVPVRSEGAGPSPSPRGGRVPWRQQGQPSSCPGSSFAEIPGCRLCPSRVWASGRGWHAALALPGAEGTRCRDSAAAYLGDKAPERLTPASRALGTCENLGDPLDMVSYLQGKEFIKVPWPH